MRAREHLTITNASFGGSCPRSRKPASTVSILLDAQDWMNDAQLNELWLEITRTAAPGARVIFRTAAAEPPSGRLADLLLERWDYREANRAPCTRDRSSIYGGFHLYVLKD